MRQVAAVVLRGGGLGQDVVGHEDAVEAERFRLRRERLRVRHRELPDRKYHAVLHGLLLWVGWPRGYTVDPARTTARRLRREDVSADLRALLGQEGSQQRAMTAALVLAVAAHREVGVSRQHGQQGDEPPGRRIPHLAAIAAGVAGPS